MSYKYEKINIKKELIKLFLEKKTKEEISLILNIGLRTINRKIKLYGIKEYIREINSRDELKEYLIKNNFIKLENNIINVSSGFLSHLPRNNKYKHIKTFFDNNFSFSKSYRESIYCLFNNINFQTICKICNNGVNFKSYGEGYNTYCSILCQQNDPEQKKKKEETMLNKYGYRTVGDLTKGENLYNTEESVKKRKNTIKNWTEQEKKEYLKKVSDGVNKAYNERGDEITRNKISTLVKNKKLSKGIGSFDKKGQELFWYLDDNLEKYNPYYATMNTRLIENIRNDEYFIYVNKISKNNFARRVDFYLKFENNLEFIIEFDPNFHNLKEDLVREIEILKSRKGIKILRVQEKDYLNNKEKVQKDLLSIISLMEKGIFNWNLVPDYLKPIYIQRETYNRF